MKNKESIELIKELIDTNKKLFDEKKVLETKLRVEKRDNAIWQEKYVDLQNKLKLSR